MFRCSLIKGHLRGGAPYRWISHSEPWKADGLGAGTQLGFVVLITLAHLLEFTDLRGS
jgi:hypothetical protein